ncbi:MAG: hydrogenase maturation protease [Deltaproteobacteria bacterium]|nr:hydrogenase maturation protease [Deltaproteobacteria bacterium]
MKDEGVGVHVARRLQNMDLPENVEVLEGGVLGLDLLDHLEEREKVVVVDAVDGGDDPGTIHRLTRADIESGKTRCHMSLHEIDLPQVFATADLMGLKVDPIIIGIEPKDMDLGYDEMTPEVEAAIPRVIELVLKEIG